MLVYHFEKDFFKLIKLPMVGLGCMLDFVRYLHYGGTDEHGLTIWEFGEDTISDIEDDEKDTMGKWQKKYLIEFNTLKSQLPEIFGPNSLQDLKHMSFEILGYNEDFHILYLAISDTTFFSFSFETRRLKKIPMFEKKKKKELETFTVVDLDVRVVLYATKWS
ncbi:hypothetical protein FRX31_014160 [Thalictrum thalictroides]|uniref:F-box protein n=1 Tax=Thalictrum thalictroides TaxID=46969 RepID=A0A7J6WH64_THATH|nr:hypothetical protein FRX31_014160 [Thalictrum thalictroides]